MAKGFFDIKAWKKADDLVVDVYESTKSFPRHQLYSLTNQMQRAAVSVARCRRLGQTYYKGLSSLFVHR